MSTTKNHNKSGATEELKSIFQIVVIALVIRTLIVEPFFIPSPSMESTLMTGDYIFSTKYSYGYSRYSLPFGFRIFDGRILASEPHSGDIAVFHSDHDPTMFRYIKRIVGLPGDKIQVRQGVLYINGIEAQKAFVKQFKNNGHTYNQYIETLPNGLQHYILHLVDDPLLMTTAPHNNTSEVTVPEGEYFMMGDNRDQSADSRSAMGTITDEDLISKAQFTFFSAEKLFWLSKGSWTDQLLQAGYWINSIQWGRMFKSVYSIDDENTGQE